MAFCIRDYHKKRRARAASSDVITTLGIIKLLLLFGCLEFQNGHKQLGMERTTTSSLVPFQPFQPGRNKLRHALTPFCTYSSFCLWSAPLTCCPCSIFPSYCIPSLLTPTPRPNFSHSCDGIWMRRALALYTSWLSRIRKGHPNNTKTDQLAILG